MAIGAVLGSLIGTLIIVEVSAVLWVIKQLFDK